MCVVISIPLGNTANQSYPTSDGGKMENINLTLSKDAFTATPDLPGWVRIVLINFFFSENILSCRLKYTI